MCLTANTEVPVATVLGSISASSDTAESEGRQMQQCYIKNEETKTKIPLYNYANPGLDLAQHSKRHQDSPIRINLLIEVLFTDKLLLGIPVPHLFSEESVG